MVNPRIKLLTVKFFFTGLFLSSALFPVGHARQSTTPPQAAPSATDPIIGAWKLNVDRSTNPSVTSELITIVQQGNEFRFHFEERNRNGYNPRSDFVTTMKGEAVKIVYSSGKEDTCKWRVTRRRAKEFEMELVCPPLGGWKDEYEVSGDGKTLTFHRIQGNTGVIGSKMDSNGLIHTAKQVRVFDKISDSEARSLIQKMADYDAGQEALASERAAAQAALDAAACSMASGQTAVQDSIANQSAWHEYICPKDGFAITTPNPPKKQSLQRVNFYKLFMTEDESIVAQLWVSAETVDATPGLLNAGIW